MEQIRQPSASPPMQIFTRPKSRGKRQRESKTPPSPPSPPSPPAAFNNFDFAIPIPDAKRAKKKFNSRRHKVCVVTAKGCDKVVPSRAAQQATFDTIDAYGLFREGVRRVNPQMSPRTKMEEFHTKKFVATLETLENASMEKEHGLVPRNWFHGGWKYCQIVTGATLVATNELLSGTATLAINYMGGKSRALPNSATGDAYINDTALALFGLRKRFQRIAVIDLSATHPQSLQDAFYFSGNVFTVSIHRYEKERKKKKQTAEMGGGEEEEEEEEEMDHQHVLTNATTTTTYGTGRRKEKGAEGEGRHTNLNVNMSTGANDENLMSVGKIFFFEAVYSRHRSYYYFRDLLKRNLTFFFSFSVREIAKGLSEDYRPDCVVLTIGTSGIMGGRAKLQYTPLGMSEAVEHLLKVLDVPTLLLGGDDEWSSSNGDGGKATCGKHARMWTLIVDAAVNATKGLISTLPNEIPDEDNESWRLMGPSFELRERVEEGVVEVVGGAGCVEGSVEGSSNENYMDMERKITGIHERFRKYRRCHEDLLKSGEPLECP